MNDNSTISKALNKLGPGAVGAVAVAATALVNVGWLGLIITVLAVAFALRQHKLDGLGRDIPLRVLTLAAMLVWSVRLDGDDRLPLVLCGVVLILLTAYEPILRTSLNVGRVQTANLPVTRPGLERVLDPRPPYLVNLVLTVAYAASAAFQLAPWALAVVIVLSAIPALGAVMYAWKVRRSSSHAHNLDAAVRAALEAHAPQFMIHFSAPAGTEYHVGMWLPYLERTGAPYVVVLREARSLNAMAAITDQPIIVAPAMGHLEQVITPSMRAAFYVNNGMKNVQSVRFSQLTHIQLLHGDSDKASSYNPVTAMFDKIFVAGQAGIDRYRDNDVVIPDEKFHIVGRPQVSEINVVRTPIDTITEPTVLYAPTWSGWFTDTDYCSLPIGHKIIAALIARGVRVICRPHPYTSRHPASARQLARVEQMLADDTAKTGRQHLYGATTSKNMSLFDCINTADAMISDVTAVASDWLFSEKPFAITDMQNQGDRFETTFPLSRAAYVITPDAKNMTTTLDNLLHTDPKATTRHQTKTYYLGDFPEDTYADAFTNAVNQYLHTPSRTPVTIED